MMPAIHKRANWIIAGVAAVCFVIGIVLSHRIEPGVRVQKVTLVGDTPALEFLPAEPGRHPVALLAHGYMSCKENLFRYGEAFAAAGFVCYDPDLPGHGMSPRTFTVLDTVQALDAIAREVGPVDVFAGHSMGGFVGGEAVREGGMKPGLFIGIGSMPVLGDNAPPLLLLAGRFDKAFPPALLKTRTDARVVISPWADHGLEIWSPVLVNAAVEAACDAVHRKPPPPPTAWLWRFAGAILGIIGAGKLASCMADLFAPLARFRGLLISGLIVVAFMLTIPGLGIDATPHPRSFPKDGAIMAVTLLLAIIAGRRRIPRWSFAALGIVVMVIAVCWVKVVGGPVIIISTFVAVLVVGTVIGWIAARRGSRLQGDIAMAVIVGCAAFQWNQPPQTAPAVFKGHVAIELNSTNYDAYLGQYVFPPDYRFPTGVKVTIWREGDQLFGHGRTPTELGHAIKLYPESETNFFLTPENGRVLTFVKNENGLVASAIIHDPGMPDSEGKKVPGSVK
jgi:hypothetical protein